jgi:hypothetical protein
MKKLLLGMLLVLGMTTSGWASTAHYDLTQPGGLNYGTVDISYSGTTASFDVKTATGYMMGDGGMFDFNVAGGAVLGAVSNIVESPANSQTVSVILDSISPVNGWGHFNTEIENGNFSDKIGELTFNLTGTWANAASILMANDDGRNVAAHIYSIGSGNTFYVTDGSSPPVPEPGTLMLLGAGFLGLAVYGKRRMHA